MHCFHEFYNISAFCGDDLIAEKEIKYVWIKNYFDGYPRGADCWWNIKSQSINEIIFLRVYSYESSDQHVKTIIQVRVQPKQALT